jgi:hypothetical protein
MKGMLAMLAESSKLVKSAEFDGTRINWILHYLGRTVRMDRDRMIGSHAETLVLLELAGFHARYHARVEPTFLLLDDQLSRWDHRRLIAILDQLQTAAEHAQVWVVTIPEVIREMPSEWTVTALRDRWRGTLALGIPVDFEIETMTYPPATL